MSFNSGDFIFQKMYTKKTWRITLCKLKKKNETFNDTKLKLANEPNE